MESGKLARKRLTKMAIKAAYGLMSLENGTMPERRILDDIDEGVKLIEMLEEAAKHPGVKDDVVRRAFFEPGLLKPGERGYNEVMNLIDQEMEMTLADILEKKGGRKVRDLLGNPQSLSGEEINTCVGFFTSLANQLVAQL